MNIELFSCAGGMAMGFREAGIEFEFAFDFAADHCESYRKNIGHKPVCIDVRDLLRLARAGMFGGTIDLLVADPPCTPWSRGGLRRGTSDERDMLEETCELIRILRPSSYLIGNVPGLDDSNNWAVVQRVIGGLSKYGYCTADFAALDAANYGVPQHRVRPFWYGHLDGPCIQWPEPTHCDPGLLTTLTLPGVVELRPWVTCLQALGHLPAHELGRPVRLRKRACNGKQHGSIPSRPARVVGTSNLSDGNVLLAEHASRGSMVELEADAGRLHSDKHPPARPHKPAPAVGAKQRQGQILMMIESSNHPPSEMDEPAMTIKASTGGGAKSTIRTSRQRAPFEGGYTPSEMGAPAKAIVKNTHGNGTVLVFGEAATDRRTSKKHRSIAAGQPSTTIRGGGNGHSAPDTIIEIEVPKKGRRKRDEGRPGQGMRVGKAEEPAKTVTAKASRVGAGESHVLAWPWPRPATTLMADDRLSPPGHHDENWEGGLRSTTNAVVISEKAATILQGFPETWRFEGKTKKARWSQIGQAMPPPLAAAVARSVHAQMRTTRLAAGIAKDLPPPSLATGKLTVV